MLTTLAIRATSAGKLKATFAGIRRNLRHACWHGTLRRCYGATQAHADHARRENRGHFAPSLLGMTAGRIGRIESLARRGHRHGLHADDAHDDLRFATGASSGGFGPARQRAQWHKQRRKATALEKEQAALKDRIAVEDKKLGQAETAHADATRPLYARLNEIKAAISDASDARRNLIRTCPDAALKAELAAVTNRLIELRARAAALRERGELVKQADREDEAARRMAEGIVPGTRTTRIDEMHERAARARKVGQEALAAQPAVQDEIAKFEREEKAVYERMTKP